MIEDIVTSTTTMATTTMAATTASADSNEFPLYTGYIGAVVAVIVFGSNFIPVKKYETGDGMFFQFIFCIAVWIPAVILNAMRGFPRFWPVAMLGGFIWATGNILVVPIIQCVGMAMGLLVWGTTNMFMGWASGRFGWFGIKPEVPNDVPMNYIGVVLCVMSAMIVSLIKPSIVEPEQNPATINVEVSEEDPLIASEPSLSDRTAQSLSDESTPDSIAALKEGGDANSLTRKLPPTTRRILGVSMCIVAGALFGSTFAPVIYIKDNYTNEYYNYSICVSEPCVDTVSQKDLDYVFSHFTGILLTSTTYFIIYCFVMKNKPRIYPQLILPALASGALWSVADICFFLANEVLEESISFPIISAGPGIIASMWGLFVFKEIQGKRNILILSVAFCFVIAGCVLTGLSKS